MYIYANKQSISISSLNVKGLKGNFCSNSKYLSQNSCITFLCELWTKPNEVNLINGLTESKKLFLYNTNVADPLVASVGLLIKKFSIMENRFLNKHVSYIHLKIDNFEMVIIGVYLPFSDSKNLNESKSLFELSLTLISTISSEFRSRDIPVILTGDEDMNRRIILKNFKSRLLCS